MHQRRDVCGDMLENWLLGMWASGLQKVNGGCGDLTFLNKVEVNLCSGSGAKYENERGGEG